MGWLTFACFLAGFGFGPASTAVKKVREGIQFFGKGEYKSANKSFTEANVAEPENPTIAFDRACALAASGDVEKAKELFGQTALARDSSLVVRSHYNLGCLSAEQGRATLGDNPIDANSEQREQGLSLLLAAVGHYRDCLRIETEHVNARHNLELIRLFIKHIQSQWEKKDRKKDRDEMGLLEFLAMIEQRQKGLRSMTRSLGNESDSPQRRQASQETSDSQRKLREEIKPLKDKIRQQFQKAQQPQPGAVAPAQDDAALDQSRQAEQLLTQLADEAARLMQTAADQIDENAFTDATTEQKESLDRLNQIFMVVAPFTKLLERATQQQETLVASSEASPEISESKTTADSDEATTESAQDTDAPKESDVPNDQEDEPLVASDASPPLDFPELAWQQSQVTDWSRILVLKAKAELDALKAQPQATPPAADDKDGKPQQKPSPAEQLEAMKKSLQKGVELGPDVEKHSSAATNHLRGEEAALALPDQQEALRLLKEIAEPLSKQDQQNKDQQKNDDKNNEKQKQQKKQDQQQKKQKDQQKQKQKEKQKPSQQQARSVLRRARERERKHRDLQKQLQRILGGRIRVDRDW